MCQETKRVENRCSKHTTQRKCQPPLCSRARSKYSGSRPTSKVAPNGPCPGIDPRVSPPTHCIGFWGSCCHVIRTPQQPWGGLQPTARTGAIAEVGLAFPAELSGAARTATRRPLSQNYRLSCPRTLTPGRNEEECLFPKTLIFRVVCYTVTHGQYNE